MEIKFELLVNCIGHAFAFGKCVSSLNLVVSCLLDLVRPTNMKKQELTLQFGSECRKSSATSTC